MFLKIPAYLVVAAARTGSVGKLLVWMLDRYFKGNSYKELALEFPVTELERDHPHAETQLPSHCW